MDSNINLTVVSLIITFKCKQINKIYLYIVNLNVNELEVRKILG